MNHIIRIVTFFMILPGMVIAGYPHKTSSVLKTGQWYKLAVWNTGIHKVSYEDLQSMGADPAKINPANIRLFGNGGGMLPESLAIGRIDDLRENPIQVVDGGDGQLNPGDYFLFYGESADKWNYDSVSHSFNHSKNLFADSTNYFLTFDLGEGKRVTPESSSDSVANYYTKHFDDFAVHEMDQRNLIRSGRIWYGEIFDNDQNSYDFPFTFTNLDPIYPLKIRTYVAARCPSTSRFFLSYNGEVIDSLQLEYTDPGSTSVFGKFKVKQSMLIKPDSSFILSLFYRLPVETAIGWLNYLEVLCRRDLIFTGPQMPFRDASTVGHGRITTFMIDNPTSDMKVWEVTDPGDVHIVQGTLTASTWNYRLPTDSLREFIAFNGHDYYFPKFTGAVPNQNLHALDPTTLVIVTHPLFINQAEQLASFHREQNGYRVTVVPTDQIYNEFASGQHDLTAIRDFMKMLYDRGQPGNSPQYLLLFGDGSYDPKNRIPGNNNMIPTFQSTESLKFLGTYVTDDYFGIMGDKEGLESNGDIDIGIGRFPVTTIEEAQAMVDKIMHYSSKSDSVMSDWRNTITFVADDENDNLHLEQAEEAAGIVAGKYPVFNVNKIFLDAYSLVRIPAGSRFPGANEAINKSIADGTLIMNYTGHGGESGWSYEQVLTITDIEAWKNYNKLPVFITATCEFSRFDNPERLSGGEIVILHPEGGAIAIYSTTRLALSTSNYKLDTSFFRHMMDKKEGRYVTMGDLIRITKNNNGNNNNIRNFVLLGDPAQNIAFPDYRIRTIGINGNPVGYSDTLLGLSRIRLSGIIENGLGQKVPTFNGVLQTRIFDKPVTYTTLGNTSDSYPTNFKMQNSLLFETKSTMKDGVFEVEFVVPKDVAIQFGRGKISYYAENNDIDANGYFDNFVIGGQDSTVDPVDSGPDISLFMDNRNFVSGGMTGFNPVLIADLFDTDGINYFGLGIGHEILAVLDNDWAHSMILNDYFQPEFNSCMRGTLAYGFTNLSSGLHTLTLKAWDMYNNYSMKEISFVVNSKLSVTRILNSPNPMFTYTNFWFEPMKDAGRLDIQIDIYNITGQPVRTLNFSYSENVPGPVCTWDGTDVNGRKLSSGIYPYKIKFKGKDGLYAEASQKLVIIR